MGEPAPELCVVEVTGAQCPGRSKVGVSVCSVDKGMRLVTPAVQVAQPAVQGQWLG